MSYCRLARLDDAPQIQAIYAPIVLETPISFEYEPPDVAEIGRRLTNVLAMRPWLVQEENGVLLGYAYASTFRDRRAYDWGVEVSIYVHADAQGHGVGRQLYTALFDVLRALNYCQVIAGATVPNAASEQLHERMGFKLVGHFPAVGYKFGRWHDVKFWHLPLRERADAAPPILNINELVKTTEWAWLIKS